MSNTTSARMVKHTYQPADTTLRYLVSKLEEGLDHIEAEQHTIIRFRLTADQADKMRRAYQAWDARVRKVLRKRA